MLHYHYRDLLPHARHCKPTHVVYYLGKRNPNKEESSRSLSYARPAIACPHPGSAGINGSKTPRHFGLPLTLPLPLPPTQRMPNP